MLILGFITFLVLITTLIPLSENQHWLVRGSDFPRLQILFVACSLLVIASFLSSKSSYSLTIIGVNSFCCLWQLWWILPYTPFWRYEVQPSQNQMPEKKVSIITSNVLTTNRNSIALINLVKEYQPDILVTLESDQWWQDQLEELESEMPFTIACPMDNLYGMHVYSKLPLHNKEIAFLVEEGIPSIHVSIELRTGDLIRAHFLHPAPPSPVENDESKERDAELILVARSVAEKNQPTIVTGDLNDVAWSRTTRLFRKISGLLDPRIGRGMFNTFHAKIPWLKWPLDHLFHSTHFTLCSIKRLPKIGSDHYPLYTQLTLVSKNRKNQNGLIAEAEDHNRAVEILEEKEVRKKEVP